MEITLLLVPVVTVIVEAIKRTGVINANYLPLLSIIIGAVAGFFFAEGIAIGILVGAGAVGLYEFTDKGVKMIKG